MFISYVPGKMIVNKKLRSAAGETKYIAEIAVGTHGGQCPPQQSSHIWAAEKVWTTGENPNYRMSTKNKCRNTWFLLSTRDKNSVSFNKVKWKGVFLADLSHRSDTSDSWVEAEIDLTRKIYKEMLFIKRTVSRLYGKTKSILSAILETKRETDKTLKKKVYLFKLLTHFFLQKV